MGCPRLQFACGVIPGRDTAERPVVGGDCRLGTTSRKIHSSEMCVHLAVPGLVDSRLDFIHLKPSAPVIRIRCATVPP